MTAAASPPFLSERALGRVVLACFALGFALLIGVIGAATQSVLTAQDHSRWVEHTYEVERRVSLLRTAVERVEASRRGYLLAPGPERRQLFETSAQHAPALIRQLRALTADNPAQVRRVAKVGQLYRRHIDRLRASIMLAERDPVRARTLFDRDGSLELLRATRAVTAAMLVEEGRLLRARVEAQQQSVRWLLITLAASGALVLAVGVSAIAVMRRYTRSLVGSRDELRALNDTLEEHVAERTRDLSRANEEIQRFAYIVSHDLRSPLVNVMGFTGELEAAAEPLAALVEAAERAAPDILTAEARAAAREDLPEAIGFIRTSTQKMDRLINAILRLSREGKRTLAREPLDLAAICDGIVSTLRHRLDAAGAEMTVERPMPALTADRLAVEQMLSNLAENAVKYLAPGRPGRITLSAVTQAGQVRISVADNGRGIDPRDHDRIFDLFRRSGMQDQPGEGIGLAHVRALAYRLGGLVDCRSALGEGAVFTLSLPIQPVDTSRDQR